MPAELQDASKNIDTLADKTRASLAAAWSYIMPTFQGGKQKMAEPTTQARIAWDVEIGATDYVYVVINTAAAAMPKDA